VIKEDQLVDRISSAFNSKQRVKRHGEGLLFSVGDDAALLGLGRRKEWVVTTDAFMEGVHFLRDLHPADSVGYKALARATSDIVAMGGTPRYFLLTLGIPSKLAGAWLNGLVEGMSRAAGEFGVALIGGDTTRTDSVAISITVIGEVGSGLAAMRSGAKRGDRIYVSGNLGGAQLGWELVRRRTIRGRGLARCLAAHLYPKIHLKLGQWLARYRVASAMIDLSDGLSTDLARLCAASRVGAQLDAHRIPCVPVPDLVARRLGKRTPDPMEMALHGGDDYALLFTVPRERESRLRLAPEHLKIKRIGEIVRGSGVTLAGPGGRSRELAASGWDPFRD